MINGTDAELFRPNLFDLKPLEMWVKLWELFLNWQKNKTYNYFIKHQQIFNFNIPYFVCFAHKMNKFWFFFFLSLDSSVSSVGEWRNLLNIFHFWHLKNWIFNLTLLNQYFILLSPQSALSRWKCANPPPLRGFPCSATPSPMTCFFKFIFKFLKYNCYFFSLRDELQQVQGFCNPNSPNLFNDSSVQKGIKL